MRPARRRLAARRSPEGVPATPPPSIPVERVAQPVRDGIGVGAHVQPVHDDVVGHVQDHGEVLGRHDPHQATEELPRADPAAKRHDLHRRTA